MQKFKNFSTNYIFFTRKRIDNFTGSYFPKKIYYQIEPIYRKLVDSRKIVKFPHSVVEESGIS